MRSVEVVGQMADDSGHAASAHGADQAADGTKQGRLAHRVQLHNV